MKKKNFLKENFLSSLLLQFFTLLVLLSGPAQSETVYFDESGALTNRMTIANIENRGFLGEYCKLTIQEPDPG